MSNTEIWDAASPVKMQDFTSATKYGRINEVINNSGLLKFNKSSAKMSRDANNKVSSSVIGAVKDGLNYGTDTATSLTISSFVAPTAGALSTFDKLGQDFDKTIHASFAGKYFHIKGTEILCAMFCIVTSLIPCEEKKKIIDMMNKAKVNLRAMQQIASATNNMIQTFNALAYSSQNLIYALQNISNLNDGSTISLGMNSGTTFLSVTAFATAGTTIKDSLDMIKKAYQVLVGSKQTMKKFNLSAIWNLSKNILWAIESMALSFIDEIINKIVAGIKKKFFDKIIPTSCLKNNNVITLLNRLLRPVYEFSAYVKQLISNLFNASESFTMDYLNFNLKSSQLREVEIGLKSIELILGNFQTFIMSCGITPCEDLDDDLKSILDSLSNTTPININGIIPNSINISQLSNVKSGSIDKIAAAIAPSIREVAGEVDVLVTDDYLVSISKLNFKNAPNQIRDMLDKVYGNYLLEKNGENINVVYAFENLCGAHK